MNLHHQNRRNVSVLRLPLNYMTIYEFTSAVLYCQEKLLETLFLKRVGTLMLLADMHLGSRS